MIKKLSYVLILFTILFTLASCNKNTISKEQAIDIIWRDASSEILNYQQEDFNFDVVKLDSWYTKTPYQTWDDVWRIIIQTHEGEHLYLYAVLQENGEIIDKVRYGAVSKLITK